jgi:hypothetical protein
LADSIRSWEAALVLRRQLGDASGEGADLCWLAAALVLAGRNSEAEAASQLAITVLETRPPGPGLAVAYRIQANLRMLNRDTAEAVAWGERALALAERFQETESRVAALNTIGAAMLVAGDLGGIDYLERSVALARQAGLAVNVSTAYTNLGSALGEIYQFALATLPDRRHRLQHGARSRLRTPVYAGLAGARPALSRALARSTRPRWR